MKNKTLIYLLLVGGAVLFIAAKKKPRYSIEVPDPDKITEDQFNNPSGKKSIIDKLKPIAKKLAPAAKKLVQKIKDKKAAKKKVGYFPDVF